MKLSRSGFALTLLVLSPLAHGEGLDPETRFTAPDAATVRDAQTGLEWTRQDNGAPIDGLKAKAWCEAKGAGWRLPEGRELVEIKDKSGVLKTDCPFPPCEVSPLFRLSGVDYWSSTLLPDDPTKAYVVSLTIPVRDEKALTESAKYLRALCVRDPRKSP
jgi:hypothetical protein